MMVEGGMKDRNIGSVFAAAGLLVLAACGGAGVQDTVGVDDSDLLAASDSVRIVSPSNIGPNNLPGGVWFFSSTYNNGIPTTTASNGCSFGAFVNGPLTPPIGTGSVELTTSDCGPSPKSLYLMGGIEIYTHQFGGTKLVDIRLLRYSTYVHPSSGPSTQATAQAQSGPIVPLLQLDYSRNSPEVGRAGLRSEGRLIFVPRLSVSGQAVLVGRWQTWNALDGEWWATGPLGSSCPQSNPCTQKEILLAAPNLIIGALAINLNGPMYNEAKLSKQVVPIYEGWKANADRLVIRKKGDGGNTVFNFERTCGSKDCLGSNE
jgi:hypothetical protein